MTALIDANILLDVLQDRAPHTRYSSLVWKLCESGRVQGAVCSFTFLNLVYIMRKQLSPEKTKAVLDQLSLIFDFADLTKADIKKAAGLCWNDFEDAVQYVTAVRLRADYIITRNIRDYAEGNIPALTPREFLQQL